MTGRGRRVLVLRDPDGGARTADQLRRRGHTPLLLPLSRIEPLDPEVPGPGRFALVLATSRHAVPWLARRRGRIGGGVPAAAVGASTARALREAGWPVALEGEGGAAELLAPLAAMVREAGAPLLYAAGRVRLPETEEGLRAGAIPFRLAEAYDTRGRMPPREEVEALGRADDALLLSVGQAEGFGRLRALWPDLPALAPERLLCLSERIARILPPGAAREVRIAPRPRVETLLDMLDGDRHGSREDLRCSGPASP